MTIKKATMVFSNQSNKLTCGVAHSCNLTKIPSASLFSRKKRSKQNFWSKFMTNGKVNGHKTTGWLNWIVKVELHDCNQPRKLKIRKKYENESLWRGSHGLSIVHPSPYGAPRLTNDTERLIFIRVKTRQLAGTPERQYIVNRVDCIDGTQLTRMPNNWALNGQWPTRTSESPIWQLTRGIKKWRRKQNNSWPVNATTTYWFFSGHSRIPSEIFMGKGTLFNYKNVIWFCPKQWSSGELTWQKETVSTSK